MQPNDKKAEGPKIVMTLKNRSYINMPTSLYKHLDSKGHKQHTRVYCCNSIPLATLSLIASNYGLQFN